MREWIYSPDGATQITLPENELTGLISSGQVDGNVFIWSTGLPEWIAIRDSGFSNLLGDTAICSVTGKTMLKSRMLQYGSDWIDPDQKENFVSGLMEGKTINSTEIRGPWPYQPLEKVGNWAKWLIMATCAFSFLFNIIEAFVSHSILSSTTAGDITPESQIALSAVLGIAGLLSFLLLIPTVVLYCIWLNRLSKNCHALAGQPLSATPGMMVGYYFIPVANLWMPLPHMKEMWSVTLDYRKDAVTSQSIVNWWWGVWIGAAIVAGFIGGFLGAIMPGNFPVMLGTSILTALVQAIAGILIFQIITRLTERQVEIFEG
jgi:hypothetical protein